MLVTFLVPDLASNILGATRRLAACIPAPHEVEIAGVAQWGGISPMYDDGFPYVRVDLYLHTSRIYFGELTFYHGSGLERFSPPDTDLTLGAKIPWP